MALLVLLVAFSALQIVNASSFFNSIYLQNKQCLAPRRLDQYDASFAAFRSATDERDVFRSILPQIPTNMYLLYLFPSAHVKMHGVGCGNYDNSHDKILYDFLIKILPHERYYVAPFTCSDRNDSFRFAITFHNPTTIFLGHSLYYFPIGGWSSIYNILEMVGSSASVCSLHMTPHDQVFQLSEMFRFLFFGKNTTLSDLRAVHGLFTQSYRTTFNATFYLPRPSKIDEENDHLFRFFTHSEHVPFWLREWIVRMIHNQQFLRHEIELVCVRR